MKLLFCVLDGAPGSLAAPDLLGAAKPNLDRLASRAKLGTVEVIKGIAPESDAAVISLLGYEAHKYYTGRGVLEATGLGIPFRDGMLAMRCNFATSLDGTSLIDRRVGRTLAAPEAKKLAAALSKIKIKDATVSFKPGIGYRGVLLVKSRKKLSREISNTDPAYIIRGGISTALDTYLMKVQKCYPLDKEAKFTASLVNEFTRRAHEVLRSHPVNRERAREGLPVANTVLCRDAGVKLPAFPDIKKRFGRKWAILADMHLEVGIGRLAGMAVVPLPVPSLKKSYYPVRVTRVLSTLKKYDCVYIHIKLPDLFGHNGDAEGKKRCLGNIDRYFFGPLLKKLPEDTMIVVTADHSTPASMKAHSADPVPLLVAAPGVNPDSLSSFDEISCSQGSLKLEGKDLMPYVMELLAKKSK